jgi:hypothetical protein
MGGIFNVAGSAVQAKGQIAQGNATDAADQYNADMARQDAGIAATQTTADIAKSRASAESTNGTLKANAGLTGGLTGSNLDILSSNAVQQELDVLNLKQQGAIQQRNLLSQASLDVAAGSNAKKQSKLAAAGTILNGIGNAVTSTAQTAALASDIRLKENIKAVGSKNGFNIYEFNYIGDPQKYSGVMAQEVEKVRPDAVTIINGFLHVFYDAIGLKMEAI